MAIKSNKREQRQSRNSDTREN